VRAVAGKTGVEPKRVDELLARYGTTASAILDSRSVHSDTERLSGASHYSHLEIDWIARQEMVVHLSDIVFRRTTLAIEGALTMEGLRQIGMIAGAALGWNAQKLLTEIDEVVTSLAKFHGLRLSDTSGLQPAEARI
jgi:glycerol-3-phosphate dehydrogenase